MPSPVFPPGFCSVVDLIGAETALWLTRLFGGTRIYVPTKIRSGHRLAQAPGDLSPLTKAHGGGRLSIPLPPPSFDRDAAMVEMRKHGDSIRQIAQNFGITERSVYRALARIREAE